MPHRIFTALLVALVACARPGSAQNAKSQLGTVSQDVAGTHIEVVYRRPVARGRALFGALVKWGAVWTPSADSAARITISTPVTINGQALAAGTYGIWTIPDSTAWTIIFNRDAAVHHTRYPQGKDVLRVQATPAHGDHVESLMFSFPMVDADSATLHMRWGTTIVPLSIHAR